MKKIMFLVSALAFIFMASPYIFAADITADSRITEVTVYPDSALLSRVASLKLDAGEQKVIFSDIIPEVDENSLRVSAEGGTQVKLFGAQLKREFLEESPSERVKQLTEEIQKVMDEIRQVRDVKEVLSQDKNYLDSVRLYSHDQIPKDLVTRMPPAKDLDDTLKFLDTRLKENYLAVMENELKERDLNKKLEVLRKELAEVAGPNRKLKRSIVVDLEVIKPGSLDLKISYLVRGAYWQPIYDARANFDKSNVELISYGIVKQNTGEEWEDVGITLSTAKPAIGGSMPYVSPWFLKPYQPPAPQETAWGKTLSRSRALGSAVQYEAFDEVKGEEAVSLELAAPALAPVYSQVEAKGIAVVYKLAKKATIKSDGSEHKLPISSQNLQAKFEYSTYPRAVLSAYLGSRVTNAPDLQLLGGRVNIFLDGDFVGMSSIGNIGPGEEFDLYLGADENVKVKREEVEKKVDETLIAGIPSPTKKTTFKYKLTVENYKSKKISVKLFDAMPISQDDRIRARIDKVSLEPKEKDWKDRKGVWLWELSLEPKQKQEITYIFVVEHPRDMQVEGL